MAYVCESFFKRAKSLRHALPSLRLTLRGSNRRSQARHSPRERSALATIARVDEARTLAEAATTQTQGVEAAALHDAVTAVCAIKIRESEVVGTCEALLKRALDRGALDFFVTAYRANPGLLSVLFSSANSRDEALFVVRHARRRRPLT